MHIVLCVKQVFDATGPFSLTEETASLDSMGLVPVINPADLAALETVREALPSGAAKVTAVSVCPKSSERILRTCVSLGADKAVRIWDNALTAGDCGGDVIVRLLAAAISALMPDIIVCGSRGLCNASGYVGPALAEYLDYPQICSVNHLKISAGRNTLTAYRKLGHGDREIVACKLPALITVDAGSVEIPYASLPQLIASERIEISVMDIASMGLKFSDIKPGSGEKLSHYAPPRPRTKRSPRPDPSLNPLQIITGGAAKKSGNLVEGESKKAAAEIVSFFISNSILSQ